MPSSTCLSTPCVPSHLQDDIPFTRFHNYLLQACTDHKFTLRQLTVLCQLVRRLLGFHKTEEVISASQVAAWTGLDTSNVARALRELTAMKVIEREHVARIGGGLGHSYVVRLVTDVGEWRVPYRRNVPLGKQESADDYWLRAQGVGPAPASECVSVPVAERAHSVTPHHSNMSIDVSALGVAPRVTSARSATVPPPSPPDGWAGLKGGAADRDATPSQPLSGDAVAAMLAHEAQLQETGIEY